MPVVEVPETDACTTTLEDIEGLRLPTFGLPPGTIAHVMAELPDLQIRENDVLISTYPKSGTHWSHEITSMLTHETTEFTKAPLTSTYVELNPAAKLDVMESPRVLNSHLPFRYLPKQVQAGKCKMIVVVRNPKDTFTSMYHLHLGAKVYKYDGKWEHHLPLMVDGKLEFGSWFDNIREWERQLVEHKDSILMVHYEDMKEDGLREIKRISKFLGKEYDEAFVQAVLDKCSFKSLKSGKEYTGAVAERLFYKTYSVFRKGDVGDWKNHFTVAQNEHFDQLYEERMQGCNIKFKFTLNE